MNFNKANFKYILKLAVILLAITFICTAILTVVNYYTKDIIAQNKIKSAENARYEVLKDADEFKKVPDGDLALVELKNPVGDIYEGIKDGKVIGYTVNVSPNGYGGKIEMVAGIDNNLCVTGIKVISMSETPGLGAKINTAEFKSGFEGKNAKDGLKVNTNGSAGDDEINAISGATISSKAVTDGVNTACDAIKAIKAFNEKGGF